MLSTQSEPADASPTRPWPADRVERWPIERLIPYANNARLHSEADLEKLAAPIPKWGWRGPVLVAGGGRLSVRSRTVEVGGKSGVQIHSGDRCAGLERGREACLPPRRQSTGGAG